MKRNTKILVVEDEAVVAMSLIDSLRRLGYATSGPAADGDYALQCAENDKPNLVLMDIRIQGKMDGIDTAVELVRRHQLPVLYLTAYTDDSTLGRAQLTNPYGYLVKPFEERELRSAIEIALHRHKSEMRLKSVKQWLAATLQSAGDGVVSVDRELRVNFINPTAEALTGWEKTEAMGRSLCEVLPIKDPFGQPCEPAMRAISEGEVVTLEVGHTSVSRSGKVYPIDNSVAPVRDDNGNIIGVVVVFRSTRDRQQFENRIMSVQRLESLGRLTGGLAHYYNNLLTVIQGNLHCILDGVRVSESAQEALEAAKRAGSLTKQLLTFGLVRQQALSPINLRELLLNSGAVLSPLLGETHTLDLHLGSRDVMVLADAALLEQVVTNLVLNARDALPEGGIIKLALKTARREPRHGAEEQNLWAVLEVIDQGIGISEEHLPRIFDPFFTTKDVGEGTGLGLATSFGIVRSHGGWLEVVSRVGEGSVFRAFLPQAPQEVAEPRERLPELSSLSKGHVLVVEDEELVARLVRRVLETNGYQVMMASCGEDAWAIADTERVDLLLTDLILPGSLSGREIAEYLRERDSSLRIAYMSGYSPDLNDVTFGSELFLAKPFSPAELLAFVQKAFGETSASKDSPR